jgi:hypothetical protein
MRKSGKFSKFAVVATATLLLSACGGSEEIDTTASEELIEAPTQEVEATGGFNSPVKIASGVSFTLSEPIAFKPGKFAAGHLPGQKYQEFKVDITNGSTAPVALATLIVAGKTATGVCVDIFDGDNGMEGAPQDPLAAGKSISFNWGLSCEGKSGESLSLILPNEGVAIIEVSGKLA